MFVNIRGTNGSGKTTLARKFLEQAVRVLDLGPLICPLSGKSVIIPGHVTGDGICVIGSYKMMSGGLDSIKSTDTQRDAIRLAVKTDGVKHVLAEGALASGLFSSWYEFAAEFPTTWAYLETSPEECVKRIYTRNGGKAFQEKNVRHKHDAVRSTRRKAMQSQRVKVLDLPAGQEYQTLVKYLWDCEMAVNALP